MRRATRPVAYGGCTVGTAKGSTNGAIPRVNDRRTVRTVCLTLAYVRTRLVYVVRRP